MSVSRPLLLTTQPQSSASALPQQLLPRPRSSSLPGNNMFAASVVPAVYKAYLGAWSLWVAFTEHHGVSSNPPDTEAFEYYLVQEAHLSASVSVVDKLAAAAAFLTA
jgi:hypothetical protein